MKDILYTRRMWVLVYANDLDPFIPEWWANESLEVLESNMVASALVHRDFDPQVAQLGDIVNTRKPAAFTAIRKTGTDDVTIQDATATNIPVPLDQYFHVAFTVADVDKSKGLKNLVDTYIKPAMKAMAEAMDQVIINQMYQYIMSNTRIAGKLGTATTKQDIIDLREAMTINKAEMEGRYVVIPPTMEGNILGIADFVNAEKIGSNEPVRKGLLGSLFGLTFYTCQNAPSVAATTTVTGAVNNAAGYAAGTTSLTVDGLSAAITNGCWLTIAGDDRPQTLVSSTGGSTPTAIVISPGLARAVVDNAVIKIYTPALVNLSGGYAAGYMKTLVIDNATIAPKTGQLVSSGVAGTNQNLYGAIKTPTTTALDLDRPLAAALADDAVLGLGPAGNYGFAFNRDALAFVNRPLEPVPDGTGARSFTVSYNNFSLRVTISYLSTKTSLMVNIDTLCGVKVLESAKGAVLLG